MPKSWFIISLLNFFVAVLMGVLLRLAAIVPVNWNYLFLLHGHSHTALLGWIYQMLYLLLLHNFLPETKRTSPYYSRLFWITQIAVFGMMISFPIQGYALYSIIFSTIHIFCSYFFCSKIWKDLSGNKSYDKILLKIALLFLLLSTFGVWSLGITGAKNAPLYQAAIQFFLHFQFNGWFMFAVLALFVNQYRNFFHTINSRKFHYWVGLLIVGTVFTYGLPLSWYFPHALWLWINDIGLVCQFFAFGSGMLYFLKRSIPSDRKTPLTIRFILLCGFISLLLKILIQLTTFWSEIAASSHYIRNFTIGFIHLIMLGIINSFLFFFAIRFQSFSFLKNRISRIGLYLFLIGFTTTEILLFVQGFYFYIGKGAIPYYNISLFMVSLLLPIGLFLVLIGTLFFRKKHKTNRLYSLPR